MKTRLGVACIFLNLILYANTIFFIPQFPRPLSSDNEDVRLNTVQLIRKYGYPAEVHKVTTQDGYILTLHRIPHGKGCSEEDCSMKKRIPVYLQHGFVCSSAGWLMNSPEKALPYKLADVGYDVWLGNFRGNNYSMKHISYLPEQNEFWNFTFEQMGLYDVPAMINYILEVTGHGKLYYIGHSMGNTAFYIAASLVPDLNEKVIASFSLAPVAFIEFSKSPFIHAAVFARNEQIALSTFGHQQFIPEVVLELIRRLGVEICDPRLLMSLLFCENLMFSLAGFDLQQVNHTLYPVFLAHYPDITSTRSFIHFLQLYNERRFCRYNHGRRKNIEIYGSFDPPDYDLTAVKAPVILLWAQNDFMANPKDVRRLEALLPNVVLSHKVSEENFNHIDFLNGITAHKLVYFPIINIMKTFE